VRQDRDPTGLLDRQVEIPNTSPNGTGALSVAGTEAIIRSVASLKTLNDQVIVPRVTQEGPVMGSVFSTASARFFQMCHRSAAWTATGAPVRPASA
jgi:hypothetical protein